MRNSDQSTMEITYNLQSKNMTPSRILYANWRTLWHQNAFLLKSRQFLMICTKHQRIMFSLGSFSCQNISSLVIQSSLPFYFCVRACILCCMCISHFVLVFLSKLRLCAKTQTKKNKKIRKHEIRWFFFCSFSNKHIHTHCTHTHKCKNLGDMIFIQTHNTYLGACNAVKKITARAHIPALKSAA